AFAGCALRRARVRHRRKLTPIDNVHGCASMSTSRERGEFRLGEVISGEPQLYCGYVPPPLMPGLASIVVAGALSAFCRRVFLRARAFASRGGRQSAAIVALPAAAIVPPQPAAEERRAA